MKDVVARATIETSTFFNTGFIHIKDNKIEGIFTFDYINILLDGKNMILNIVENSIYFDEDILHHDFLYSTYQSSFPYLEFYIPDTYHLYDESQNLLTFSIDNIVLDQKEKLRVIECIKKIRC